ncbi:MULTISPECIES: hypothetical protein [Chitinophagaceae]
MDNRLMYYLDIVDKYFFRDDVLGFDVDNKRIGSREKIMLEENTKILYLENLHRLDHLKNELMKDLHLTYLRDLSLRSFYLYNFIISEDENIETGLCVMLSFVGNMIGVYYFDMALKRLKDNKRPIKYAQSQDDTDPYMYDVSYFPFSKRQSILSAKVIDIVEAAFPDFVLFDNAFSGFKIKNVRTYEGFLRKWICFRRFLQQMCMACCDG